MKAYFVIAALMLAALPARAEVLAHDVTARLGIGERPGVLFAAFHNNGEATRMIAAESPSFSHIELHTHEHMDDGMMRMKKVDAFPIPADGMVKLQPGGDHLMLFGFNGRPGDRVTITVRFADGRSTEITTVPQQRQKKSKDMKMDKHHGHHGHKGH